MNRLEVGRIHFLEAYLGTTTPVSTDNQSRPVLRQRPSRRPVESRKALATLSEAYWYPLYFYIRRRGRRVEKAQDLNHELFSRRPPCAEDTGAYSRISAAIS